MRKPCFILVQAGVGKAEELVIAHQDYQNNLHAFKDWLEQQQEKLSYYTQLEGDVDILEETLNKLQVRAQNNLFFGLLNGILIVQFLILI